MRINPKEREKIEKAKEEEEKRRRRENGIKTMETKKVKEKICCKCDYTIIGETMWTWERSCNTAEAGGCGGIISWADYLCIQCAPTAEIAYDYFTGGKK